MLARSRRQSCKDPEAFCRDVAALVDAKLMEFEEKVNASMGGAVGRHLDMSSDSFGAVAAVGEESRAHWVSLGDAAFPTSLWMTRCSWEFGLAEHVRRKRSEANCGNCL